jgi:hypothetical protein
MDIRVISKDVVVFFARYENAREAHDLVPEN